MEKQLCPFGCGVEKQDVFSKGGIFLGRAFPCNCYVAYLDGLDAKRKVDEDTRKRQIAEKHDAIFLSRIPQEHADRLARGKVRLWKITDYTRAMAAQGRRPNLCILGCSFSGKTFEALWYLREIKEWNVVVVTPSQLVDAVFGNHKSVTKDMIENCTTLMIDDVDKIATDTELRQTLNVLDAKYKSQHRIILTANSTEETLFDLLKAPSWNRIIGIKEWDEDDESPHMETIIKTGRVDDEDDMFTENKKPKEA